MGYDVHITRGATEPDQNGPSITQEEWVAYIDGDPELVLTGASETRMPNGAVLRVGSPGMALWTAHPGVGRRKVKAWITLGAGGRITVKNPDEVFLRKMWQVADALGARVVGEQGEAYGEDGRPVGGEA